MTAFKIIPYERSFASHEKAQYWHVTKNGNIVPRNVFKSSHKKYWFNCNKCNHDFETALNHISEGKWCPYCSNQKLCKDDNCEMCFNNSFASHEKSQYWHPINNGVIMPINVFKSSNTKYWFSCNKCKHDFESTLNSISNGGWCPYCSNQKLCKDDNCEMCFNNSFASREKSQYWHPINNGVIIPRDVFKSTHTKYWFNCNKCKHDFESTLNHISNGVWCPYCANKKICKDINCEMCFNNSFASHEKSQYWHSTKNEEIIPRDVFKSTHTKYWFSCNECNHDFESVIYSISNGVWCPYCVNKTETKMKEHLEKEKENLQIKHIKHHYRPKWANLRKTHNTFYEYDFYIELINGVKIIIEIDGRQHYEQVSNWNTPLYNQIRDNIKERLAANQEFNIIRLNQQHIWEDKKNWQQTLDEFVKKKYENNDEIVIYHACMW